MIEFREDTHEYFLDGRKLISVTQLMRKHGLAPSYDAVPSEVLKAKAERGTLIHKEIENYIKNGEFGFTSELEAFVDHIKKHDVTPLSSEVIVYDAYYGVAGTVDMFSEELFECVINDFKTTATLHKDAVSWQLSIYAYINKTGNCATKAKAYHFQPDGTLKVVDIPLKPLAEVERLLECERNGYIYTQAVVVSETALAELVEVESLIKSIEEQKKVAEAQAVELRAALMKAMEQNGVTSFENENIKVTYVAATKRTAIDSAKLKKELPEIAEQYTKTSNVKASLRITLKEANNG